LARGKTGQGSQAGRHPFTLGFGGLGSDAARCVCAVMGSRVEDSTRGWAVFERGMFFAVLCSSDMQADCWTAAWQKYSRKHIPSLSLPPPTHTSVSHARLQLIGFTLFRLLAACPATAEPREIARDLCLPRPSSSTRATLLQTTACLLARVTPTSLLHTLDPPTDHISTRYYLDHYKTETRLDTSPLGTRASSSSATSTSTFTS
jgi:hypothetical protein